MTSIVKAYNDCGDDAYEADIIFTEWAGAGSFCCTTCGKAFRVDQLKSPPAPQDEVTCATCLQATAEETDDDAAAISSAEEPS